MSHTSSSWILVTGATDGIGFETAAELARRGFGVILHGRSEERLAAAAARLGLLVPGARVESARADYADLDSVRRLGRQLQERFPVLAGVVHNAGTYETERRLTPDGWEATWQINHLAPFLLHHYLDPLLVKGAPSRAVWVSSVAHNRGTIPWDNLNRGRSYNAYSAYADSKLANVLSAFAWARQHRAEVTAQFALHPGVIDTKLLRTGFAGTRGAALAEGIRGSVSAVSDPVWAGRTAVYLSDGRETEASPAARDADLQEELFFWTRRALAL